MKKINALIHKSVHVIEYVIAAMTMLVLLWLLGCELYKMITVGGYLSDSNVYLKSVLNIVVGLEFVRMLINLTPANTLEVLIVAIARQVIINHENPINNIVCVLCIGGLFAIRRFLIPKSDLKVELSESTDSETELCRCEDEKTLKTE